MTRHYANLKLMGTLIELVIYAPDSQQLQEKVFQQLHHYNSIFSANDEQSQLSKINQSAGKEPLTVNSDLFELIAIGKEHSLLSPSNLNIALGSLVKTWKIGFEGAAVPVENSIKDKLKLTNPENILLNPNDTSVFLKYPDMQLDLGSLAKGFIADKIMICLQNQKVKAAMINLGGNIRTFGPNKERLDSLWHIGIQNPAQPRGHHLALLPIKNAAIATSGNYERFLQVGDTQYSHILNKETGYPITTDVASLSIIAPTALETEIWTTRLSALSSQEVLSFINDTAGIEGIIVTTGNKILTSDKLIRQLHYL